MRAALHHLIGGDRGIETAREQAEHFAGGVRGQAAWTGNFSRINERRSGGDFDSASHVGIVQLHAYIAARISQAVEQEAANDGFDLRTAVREGFIAALGADGEGSKR